MRSNKAIPLYFDDIYEVRRVSEDLERLRAAHPDGFRAFYTAYPNLAPLIDIVHDITREEDKDN